MSNTTLMECLQPESVTVERVNYFPRQLLTADDMFADQEYFLLKLRRHNRFLHGWGTVCGLLVTAAPTSDLPWQVQISAGYALGPYGDEIYVADTVLLDLASCSAGPTDPCEPGSILGSSGSSTAGETVYVAIQYSECFARPVRVMPSGCGCDETACQNSRIRDSFQIQCLSTLPPSYQFVPPGLQLCDYINGHSVPDCPPCPADPWVVLASVVLPAFRGIPLVDNNIDNISVRRQIFSTAVLQDQIIDCCCGPTPTPTPAPQSADLRIGQVFTAITDPATGLAGLQLAITVTNLGPSTAINASVTANIPLIGQGILVVQPNSPLTLSGTTLQANLGTMTNGQVVNLTATILPKTIPFPPDAPVVSTASTQSATFDPNMTNNSSVAQAQIPEPTRVQSIDPTRGQVIHPRETVPSKIVVTFTKQLSAATVNAQSFKVVGPTQGTPSYDPASNTATFAAATSFADGEYTITLVGTGANPIRDVDGLALDGNGDGKPGGDFVSKFTVRIG